MNSIKRYIVHFIAEAIGIIYLIAIAPFIALALLFEWLKTYDSKIYDSPTWLRLLWGGMQYSFVGWLLYSLHKWFGI